MRVHLTNSRERLRIAQEAAKSAAAETAPPAHPADAAPSA
jgi:GntR family transcriptional repressor for pyruvate dehydrogenase complex